MAQHDVCGLSMDVSMNDDSARALESNKKYLFVCFFYVFFLGDRNAVVWDHVLIKRNMFLPLQR